MSTRTCRRPARSAARSARTTATSFAPLHKRRRPPLAVAGAVISATDASSPQWRLKMVALRQIAAPCMIRLVIGQSPRRKEDERLITGRGRFIDDIVLPGLLHLAVVRSTHARARIAAIDATAARNLPGVTVVVAGDFPELDDPLPAARADRTNPYVRLDTPRPQ